MKEDAQHRAQAMLALSCLVSAAATQPNKEMIKGVDEAMEPSNPRQSDNGLLVVIGATSSSGNSSSSQHKPYIHLFFHCATQFACLCRQQQHLQPSFLYQRSVAIKEPTAGKKCKTIDKWQTNRQ